MNNLTTYYTECVNQLTTYAPAHLFTKSEYVGKQGEKEKKLEKRCVSITDSFYNMSNFNVIRESLRSVLVDFQLGCNEVIVDEVLSDCGRLHAVLEHINKQILKECKPEQCLREFYSLKVEDKIDDVLAELEQMSVKHSFYLTEDVASLKKTYYDSYKSMKKWLNESYEHGNKNWK